MHHDMQAVRIYQLSPSAQSSLIVCELTFSLTALHLSYNEDHTLSFGPSPSLHPIDLYMRYYMALSNDIAALIGFGCEAVLYSTRFQIYTQLSDVSDVATANLQEYIVYCS